MEAVSQHAHADATTGQVTSLRGLAPPDRLPHPLTSFIGREAELHELGRALAGTRLLTLTGPGGCGKTRLALQLADRFEGGVWWVELAAVTDERLRVRGVAGLRVADASVMPRITSGNTNSPTMVIAEKAAAMILAAARQAGGSGP